MTKDQKKVAIIAAGIVFGIFLNHVIHNFSRMRSEKSSNTLLNDLRQTNAGSGLTVSTNSGTPKTP
jgi:hypothetical protein